MQTDTIAAIATALSDSGIGIIRISGENAISVADSIFVNKFGKKILMNVQSHTIHYGFIIDHEYLSFLPESGSVNYNTDDISLTDSYQAPDCNKKIIDEVLVSVMKAPYSYTRENVVEINCHGGVYVTQKIMETILHAGARLAEPGEFTKRAFLNGRIDLSKAEAVMDLIQSRNEMALSSSVSQLRGDLSKKIKKFREILIYEIAFIESALDDPEHISLSGYPDRLYKIICELILEHQKLINSSDNGKLIKEGISTVILGKPNAGKSSLLNILVGKERAIVTDIAGTTRDIIEEHINLNGISLNIIDTAGIRNTGDKVEKIGVDIAKKYAKDADLIVYVVDSSVEIDDNDREIMSLIRGKNTIILLNKSDKDVIVGFQDIENLMNSSNLKNLESSNIDDYINNLGFSNSKFKKNIFEESGLESSFENKNFCIKIIKTSTKNLTDRSGIVEFENAVEELFFSGILKNNSEILITNIRHKEALQNSLNSLMMVKKSIEDGMEEDFFSIDLMSSYSELGKIIGEKVEDDLVEEIFSKFCMGK